MQELILKVNKLGAKEEVINKKTLDKAGKLVKASMESKAPRAVKTKKNNGKYRYVWLLKGKFFSRDFDGNYTFSADEDE